MPKAQPPPVAVAAPTVAQIDGAQEDHTNDAQALAEVLGWPAANPDWTANDIAVVDAQNYLTKVLHEAFQAGTRGDDPADILSAALEHLGITDPAECDLLEQGINEAFHNGDKLAVASGVRAEPIRSNAVANLKADIDLRSGS